MVRLPERPFEISEYFPIRFLERVVCSVTEEWSLDRSLVAMGVRRYLEAGAGNLRADLRLPRYSLDVLAEVKKPGGGFYFDRGDLVACDPYLAADLAPGDQLKGRVSCVSGEVSFLAEKISRNLMAPFDLVASRGVISAGNLAGCGEPEMFEASKRIMKGKIDCLRDDNPLALVLASTFYPDSCLITNPIQWEELRLRPIAWQESTRRPVGGSREKFGDRFYVKMAWVRE